MTRAEEIWETIKNRITEDSDEEADDKLLVESGYLDALLLEAYKTHFTPNWEIELDKLKKLQK